MKISGPIIASLFFCASSPLASAKKNDRSASDLGKDKFQTYHSRSLSQSSHSLDLDDGLYDHLTSPPRDYSVAVLLTATEAKFGCVLCRTFGPEWDLLAKSWNKGDRKGESRLLFGTLDFTKGKNTFQKVLRELSSWFWLRILSIQWPCLVILCEVHHSTDRR